MGKNWEMGTVSVKVLTVSVKVGGNRKCERKHKGIDRKFKGIDSKCKGRYQQKVGQN